MDPDQLRQHLKVAEEHAALGLSNIDRQKRVIAGLEESGHSADLANRILSLLEDSQLLHEKDRDRLRKALALD
jgi:hypothetical protein